MPKVIAGILAAGTIIAGGIGTANQMTNPYTTVGSQMEISASSTLPQAGTEKAMIDTTQPKITLQKFNGEVSMGVTLQGLNATGARKMFSSEVDWNAANEQMQVVPLAASSTFEDGGYEINVVLNSKPASNVFNFSIDGAQNLDFFYQAPLWQEAGLKAPTKGCTDTDCITSDATSHRPDNVVGSYAVYYKGHANHVVGQTNYATGKAYQVYRPLVTDANGATTWGQLSYSNGILTLTVPQSFLDNASYPVTIDPTFGYTTIGGSTFQEGGSTSIGRITETNTFSGTGTITSLSWYNNMSGACSANNVIYSGTASPYSRVDYSANTFGAGVAQWTTLTAQVGATLTNGTDYSVGEWLVAGNAGCSGTGVNIYFDALGTNSYRDTATTNNSPPPTTFTNNSTSNRTLSAYITYTASGGGSTAVKVPDIISF